jgi:hypothetical protein
VRRWSGRDERLLIVNFGDQPFATAEYGGGWRLVLASKAGARAHAHQVGAPPRSAAVFGRAAT